MGYFGSGLVFIREPAWNAFGSLPAGVGLVGYRHRERPVWLLDAWTCTSREHWPFTDELDEATPLPINLVPESEAIVNSFRSVCEALPSTEVGYASGWLRYTAASSVLALQTAFYFAADDELVDMSCRASAGKILGFEVRFGGCTVAYRDQRLTITPIIYLEDPDLAYPAAAISQLAAMPGVAIATPLEVANGAPLYECAVRNWPPEAGDPDTTLGVGTWDPFEHVGRDLEVVFRRPCASPPPQLTLPRGNAPSKRKPWWQFWG